MRYFELLRHRERSEAISSTVGEIASAEKLPRNDVRLVFISLMLFSGIFLSACATTNDGPTTFVASENLDEMVIPVLDVTDPELPAPLSGKLSIVGNEPIFEEGQPDSWDQTLAFPGAVLYHGGLYHMFYNGLTVDRNLAGGGIGYAVSANGVDWYRMAEESLLNWDDTVGEDAWLRASSALIEDDGIWVLYFSTLSRGVTEDLPMIYRATAPAPNGPWTFDDVSLLEGGEAGAWDISGVTTPIVLKTDNEYRMYYLNAPNGNRRGISGVGLATSSDGIVWNKYDDPTTEDEFSASDPVFVYDGNLPGFDLIQVHFIWQTSDGYSMVFGVGRNNTSDMYIMTSEDGITWSEPSDEPIFTVDDVEFLDYATAYKVLFADGAYKVYFYGGLQTFGDIYLATVTE